MNTVNRVILVILLLVAIPLCTILLVWPIPILQALGAQSAELVDFLNSLQVYVRVPLGILLAVALSAILILLLILELRRPATKAVRVKRVAGGEVLVGAASIADGLKYEVDQLTSVLRSRPKVSGRRDGVIIELDVDIAAGIDVPGKAEQIVEATRRVVEERMGLKLARLPRVNLRTVPYPSLPGAAAGPKEALPAGPQSQPPAAGPEEIGLH